MNIQPLSSRSEFTPSISTPEATKAHYDDLVAQYVAASPQEAKSINERLVKEFKVDLEKRTYDGIPLRIKADKAAKDVATVAYIYFEMGSKKTAGSIQTSQIGLGFGSFALGFARMVNLFGRLIEVLKGLFRSPEPDRDMQKLYLAKAVELHTSMMKLATEKLLPKMEKGPEIISLLKEMGDLLKKAEKHIKNNDFFKADEDLAHMSDRLAEMKEKGVGIFRRLLEEVAGTSGSSYKDDLEDVNGLLENLNAFFVSYEKEVPAQAKSSWEMLKKEAEECAQEAKKFDPDAKAPSIDITLSLLDLRLKVNKLGLKRDAFINQHFTYET